MAWVSTVTAVVTAIAAIIAIIVSLNAARQQNILQERQLKQDLFDRRYAVFVAVGVFMNDVLRANGAIELPGEEYGRFLSMKEQAEFLFGIDVTSYLEEVQKIAMDLHPIVFERDHLARMNQQNPELIEPFYRLMKQILANQEKRVSVFRPYLQLNHHPESQLQIIVRLLQQLNQKLESLN